MLEKFTRVNEKFEKYYQTNKHSQLNIDISSAPAEVRRLTVRVLKNKATGNIVGINIPISLEEDVSGFIRDGVMLDLEKPEQVYFGDLAAIARVMDPLFQEKVDEQNNYYAGFDGGETWLKSVGGSDILAEIKQTDILKMAGMTPFKEKMGTLFLYADVLTQEYVDGLSPEKRSNLQALINHIRKKIGDIDMSCFVTNGDSATWSLRV